MLPADSYCRVDDLTAGTTAPRHAVSKVFYALAQRDILESARGSGGGYRLAKGALDRTLAEVIEAVEGKIRWTSEIDRGLFVDESPLNALLAPIASEMEGRLRTTTLRALLQTLPVQAGCCATCQLTQTAISSVPSANGGSSWE